MNKSRHCMAGMGIEGIVSSLNALKTRWLCYFVMDNWSTFINSQKGLKFFYSE